MDRVQKDFDRHHYEVCYVRNLEMLSDDELRLVMRDKVQPVSPAAACGSLLRIAHSDSAMAVMFEVNGAAGQGVDHFSVEIDNGVESVGFGSDSHIYFRHIAVESARYYSHSEPQRRWYVVVMLLSAMGLQHNSQGVNMVVTMPHLVVEDAVVCHCEIDLV